MDQLTRYHTNRSILIEEMGGECKACGSTDQLEFDHIDPLTKLFDISKKFNLSLDRVREEAKKCQLLCHDCHERKSAEESSQRNIENINNRGSAHPSSIFSAHDVDVIRTLLKLGHSQASIGRMFDASRHTIGAIARGKTHI